LNSSNTDIDMVLFIECSQPVCHLIMQARTHYLLTNHLTIPIPTARIKLNNSLYIQQTWMHNVNDVHLQTAAESNGQLVNGHAWQNS